MVKRIAMRDAMGNRWMLGDCLVGPDGRAYNHYSIVRAPAGDEMSASDYMASGLFLDNPSDQGCPTIQAFLRLN